MSRSALWVLGLLVMGQAAPVRAQVWVVAGSDGDADVAAYLVRAFAGAAPRPDLREVPVGELRGRAPEGSILRVDVDAGRLTAIRAGTAEALERGFDGRIARDSRFAIAVAASELLALPLAPRAGLSEPEALAPAAPTEPPGTAAPPPDGAAAEDGPADARAAPADGADPTPEAARGVRSDAPPSGVRFRAAAHYLATLTGPPLTDLHRPALELGAVIGGPDVAVVLAARGEVFGFAAADLQDPSQGQFEMLRHAARLQIGVRVSALWPLQLGASLTAGVGITSARVYGADGGELAASDRAGLLVGAEATVGIALGAGLRVEVGGGAAVDPDGERLLVRGAPVASDGPWAGLLRAGLAWEPR